ncbi:unnamed protein product [Phytophthora fragariaefolia]|uniref:Unnamed protein product n=1 Tax=Phytophthora fragariaefolia TaxID=1490495 RepID=A0A9W6UAN0_9STRA|nr:unnamed protein product [Phytophthora fragariaefolia]
MPRPVVMFEQWESVTKGSALDASASGADAIGPNIEGRSVVRRRGNRGASAPGANAASSADGCKRHAPEMLACSRAAGLQDDAIHNQAPPAIKERSVHGRAWTKEDTRNRVPHEKRTAQASQAVQVSVRDRDTTSGGCRADTATRDARRDPECLNAYEYWSPVSEDGAGDPSDASFGGDLTSDYELEALCPRPARWTLRADLHPLAPR